MAARKSAPKAPAAKKKAAGTMAKKKTAVVKKAAGTTAKKKTAVVKKAAGTTAKKTAARKKATAKSAPAKPKGAVSSMSVNPGHVFSLRPRMSTSFRPDDLRSARHFLQDESYATIEEAARAVAEKALDLTHNPQSGRPFNRGR